MNNTLLFRSFVPPFLLWSPTFERPASAVPLLPFNMIPLAVNPNLGKHIVLHFYDSLTFKPFFYFYDYVIIFSRVFVPMSFFIATLYL